MTIQTTKQFQEDTDQHFTITWSARPPKEQQKTLEGLIRSWYNIGMYGSYDGHLSFLSDIEHSDNKTYWWVDMGTADYDKATNELEKLLNQFNDNYKEVATSMNQQWIVIESLFVGKSKRRFKWQKIKLGDRIEPFKDLKYYLTGPNYSQAFGFLLDNIGQVSLQLSTSSFITFNWCPPEKRKKIKSQKDTLILEDMPAYTEEQYNAKDINLPGNLTISVMSKQPFAFPIKCVLRIGNLSFYAYMKLHDSSDELCSFNQWYLESNSNRESYKLYLPYDIVLFKQISFCFEKTDKVIYFKDSGYNQFGYQNKITSIKI